ncbi:MAG: hypothetical protein IKU40_06340 [Clostridia bacterium]|nr:hypothetical protein [Clostridia bacterium]
MKKYPVPAILLSILALTGCTTGDSNFSNAAPTDEEIRRMFQDYVDFDRFYYGYERSMDPSDSIAEDDGDTYYRVKEGAFLTYSEIEEFMDANFTDEFQEQEFRTGIFCAENDNLYASWGSAGTRIEIPGEIIDITRENNRIDIDVEYSLQYVPENDNDTMTWTFVLIPDTDGVWKFNEIRRDQNP